MARRRSRHEILATLWRATSFLVPYRMALGAAFVLIIVFTVCSLAFPLLLGKIVNYSTQPGGWAKIEPLLLIYTLILGVRGVTQLTRNHLIQTVGAKVTGDIRIVLFSHLQKLSIRFYDELQTGRIVSRLIDDSHTIYALVTGASVTLISDLMTAACVFVLLFYLNWQLAIVSVLVTPLFVLNYLWNRRRMRLESRRHRRHWEHLVGYVSERIANNRVVRAFAAEDCEENTFRGGVQADFVYSSRIVWRNTVLLTSAELLSGAGQLLAIGFGAWLISRPNSHFTTGGLFAFLGCLGMLYTPIVRIVEANASIQTGATALEKIYALLDTKPHIPDNAALRSFPPIRGKVEFRDVNFGYRIGEITLDRVSFAVHPGEMVALVGPSGAGKSTVITLLSRFYDPTSGQVLIDDEDISTYNVQSFRRQIGIVMQDSILFSGTIAENIRYARPEASHDEVIAAARSANAHEFIQGLRHGYDSRVGERGVSLSGGQRQRIAIARVLLKDPRILILDEATSALDSQSERLIQEATEKLMSSRTAIVIAHRLSTVVKANRILVMEKGRIVASGTHAELLAQPGLYRNLYELQFAHRAAA